MHIRTDEISDKDMEIWFSNTLGSPLFTWDNHPDKEKRWDELYSIIARRTPKFEFGEHSFLKGALTDDDRYVSDAVQLEDIIKDETGYGELITEEIIKQVKEWADSFKGDTSYYHNQIDMKELIKFLKKHKGKKAFFTCW